MTRSDDKGESQEHRRSRVCARDDGKERERAVKKGSDNNRPCVRERQRPTGLGARARPTWGRGGRLVRLALDVGLDSLVLSHHGERTRKPQSQMPASAQAGVGMTWLLAYYTIPTYKAHTTHILGINKV